jgi:putative thioredoxin
MNEPSPELIEVTRENFEREVIERSRELPVVVDFWATWCQPCRTLGPILEKLAKEFAGQFVLAKADTEAVPEIAAAFAVRSIPAVFGVRGGQVVDAFIGALPETRVREWLRRLLPTPEEQLISEAKKLESTDPNRAESRYREALALGPENAVTKTGLARALLHQGKLEEASALIASLEARGYLEPEAESVKAELQLQEQAGSSGGVPAARAGLAAKPDDPSLRLQLAEALAASGPSGYPEALEIALALVEEHHKETSDEARRVMVNIFQLLPADSELSAEYRRRLSAALY